MTKLEEYIKQIQKAQQDNPSGWTASDSMSMTRLRDYLSTLNTQGTGPSPFYDRAGNEIEIPVTVRGRLMSLEDAVKEDPSFKTIKRPTHADLKQLTKEKKSQEPSFPAKKLVSNDTVVSSDIPAEVKKAEQEFKNSTPPNLPSDVLSQPVDVEQNLPSGVLSKSVDVEQNLPSDVLAKSVDVEQNLPSDVLSQPVGVDRLSSSVEAVSHSQKQEHLDILDSPVWQTSVQKAEPIESEAYFGLEFFQSDGDVGDESDSEKKSVWMNYKNFENALLGKDSWFTYEDLVAALKNENGQYVIDWGDGNMDEYRGIADFYSKQEIVDLLITKHGASQEQQSSKEEIKTPNTNLTFFEGQPLNLGKPAPSVAVKEKIVITYIQFLKYLESPKGVQELTGILEERNKNEIQFKVPGALPADVIGVLIGEAKLKRQDTITALLADKFLDEMNPGARNNNQTQAALPAPSRMAKINDYLDKQYNQYMDNKKDEIRGHAHFITHVNTFLYPIYQSFISPNRDRLGLYEGANIEMHFLHSNSITQYIPTLKNDLKNDVFILDYVSEINIPTLVEKTYLLKAKKIPFIIVLDDYDSLQEKDIKSLEQFGPILCIECSNPTEPEGLNRLFQQAAIISDMNEKDRDHYRQAYWAELQYQLYLSPNVDGVASAASMKLLNELYSYYHRYSSTSLEQARNSLVSSSVFQFLAPSAVTKTVEAKIEDNKKGGALKLIQKLLLDMRNIAGDSTALSDDKFSSLVPYYGKEPEFTLAEVKALLEGQLGEKIRVENSPVHNILLAKRSKLEYEASTQQVVSILQGASFSRTSTKG